MQTRTGLCMKAALAVIVGSLIIGGIGARMAHSAPVWSAAVGANGCWVDSATPLPDDFELGGNIAQSMQPHLSLVGAGYYGVNESYLRASAGIRFTATNPDDPDFSIGLGAQYAFSSEPAIRAQGLFYDATMGWRAWPNELPNVFLIAQGSYNPEENQAVATAGVRLLIGGSR